MAWGGVLGIIAGVMVALYALPPILRSFYGEEGVDYGAAYSADGRHIEVVAVSRDMDVIIVRLTVRSNQLWSTTEEDWQLEVTGLDDWLPALPPDPSIPETSFELELATERTLVLRFSAPGAEVADAAELHLADPRVAFSLAPE